MPTSRTVEPSRLAPRALRGAGAALAVLALTACASVEAAAPEPEPAYTPHPAIAIVDRLADGGADGLPDLVGLAPPEAVAALAQRGLRARVVAFEDGRVSAQYPAPGAPAPADGGVIVWTGDPPVPPPPAPPPDPEDVAPRSEAEDEPGPATTVSDGGAGVRAPTGGDDPQPPRTSPRRLAALEPGTSLEGPASWYGDAFAGRTTACGDVYDPDEPTLATRELRCGTRVEITGPSGRTVEAVATDWGPAEWTNRRFDLSRAAFAALGSLTTGVIPVTVEVLR